MWTESMNLKEWHLWKTHKKVTNHTLEAESKLWLEWKLKIWKWEMGLEISLGERKEREGERVGWFVEANRCSKYLLHELQKQAEKFTFDPATNFI